MSSIQSSEKGRAFWRCFRVFGSSDGQINRVRIAAQIEEVSQRPASEDYGSDRRGISETYKRELRLDRRGISETCERGFRLE
ncbi:hypothetical protein L3X38_025423 [Prunus dulcis]|uniref:Uncharacterized protein n=1 Tax=Prunus dulcis TaxID=3755 RepID=A0AAD4Z718_PRUDU|nr:hypothetical protein L3X38_025423 [Prunus dulcis]